MLRASSGYGCIQCRCICYVLVRAMGVYSVGVYVTC